MKRLYKWTVATTLLIVYIFVFTVQAGTKVQVSEHLAESTSENITKSSSVSSRNNVTIEQQWELFESKVKGIAKSLVKMLLPQLMGISNSMNISSSCMREFMMVMTGIKNIKFWALRFFDASAKILDGILTGAMSSFGDYDECINTMVYNERPGKDNGKLLFQGQYCSIDLKPPLPPKKDFYKLDEVLDELKNFSQKGTAISEAAKFAHFFHFLALRLGVCVPSGCTVNDVQQIATTLGNSLALNAEVKRCEIKTENEFTPIIIAVISIFSFLGFLMLIGSLIDLYSYFYKRIFTHKGIRMLLAFSFISSFKKLINTETSSDNLSCLNGIRFFGMSWIILGHTYLVVNYQLMRGLESVRDYARDFAFQAVINASVAVDTFFLIGGLLICYLTVKHVKTSKNKLNIKHYIFHRFWRILPAYAAIISFMFMASLIGSGPVWYDTTHHYVQACYDNWWTNFLFINNFYNADKMCLPQSWYVASDMQLYIAALLVLLPLLRWPKVGISIAVIGIVMSMFYGGLATYLFNYPPAMLFAHPDPVQRTNYWANFYFKPFIHAGPYCIGLLLGYLLVIKPNFKIPKKFQIIGWCCAIATNMAVLYGVWDWNKGRDPTLAETILYASFNRAAWSAGVAWVIVCCTTGHGGVINYILSWKVWIPLARLTYISFLLHPLIQISANGNLKSGATPQHYFILWVYLGTMCVTYASAFVGNMLIEGPFLALEKIILPMDRKKEEMNQGNIKGILTMSKNGDIATIVPISDNFGSGDKPGLEKNAFVYKL